MIVAMLRVMALGLIRDRGALAMAFVLPPTIFVIFAAIFSGTSGEDLRLTVAFGSVEHTPRSERLETALRADSSFLLLPETLSDRTQIANLVESGEADVGLLFRDDFSENDAAPLAVLTDPGKLMAGAILAGRVQQLVAQQLPDLALLQVSPAIETLVGGFTPEQSARLTASLDQLAEDITANDGGSPLLATETLGAQNGSGATVTYYAGAIAVLFLLFSAMQGAATLIEERNSGIVDRIVIGPAGTDVVVLGKFLFLTAQGVVQVALIFVVAALVYGVEMAGHVVPWLLTTLAASAAAAGLGLAVAAVCTTKQQAQTISTFVVLVCSAVGGSMVPRFMMPPWLQSVGWYTPNAWAIEAYNRILWRGEELAQVLPELGWLVAMAMIGTAAAVMLSRLRLRL